MLLGRAVVVVGCAVVLVGGAVVVVGCVVGISGVVGGVEVTAVSGAVVVGGEPDVGTSTVELVFGNDVVSEMVGEDGN